MKRRTRILAGIAALLICLSVSAGVFADTAGEAYEIPSMNLTMKVPQGTYIFTPDISNNDVRWEEAGLGDPVQYKTEYQELGVVAHLSTNGGKTNVYVSRKESEKTKYYYSLAAMTEEERQNFLKPYNADQGGSMTSVAEFYTHPQTPFVKADISSEFVQEDNKAVYEQLYFTIINGYTVAFQTYAKEEITAETQAYIKALVDSVNFTNILPKPETPAVDIGQALMTVGLLAAAVIALVLAFVLSRVRSRQRKKQTRVLAERLSVYRNGKKEAPEILSAPLFENTSSHSDEAIRHFAKFQAYLRKPLMPIFTIVLTVGAVIISILLDGEWWMTLLLALAAAFCIYKFAMASYTIEKALKKVYSHMKSREGKYTFYEEEFTISGMQRTESYPYFQITAVEEYKDWFYLYFGENTTYFVEKKSFTLGTAEAFKTFIHKKTATK